MIDNIKRSVERTRSAEYDHGLRSYMMSVFNYMCLALIITGGASYLVAYTALRDLFFTVNGGLSGLGMIFAFAPFVFVMVFSFKINSMQASTARAMLLVYSGLMGVSLAPVLMIYTGESIAKAFFTTSALFGAMSLYGYTTKRDLTSFGSFMFMGLIGILIASLVNMFLHSGPLDFAISILGVVIFTGLTAWDVQKITRLYDMLPSGEMRNKAAVMGALSLYMDFVNLFLYLLRFMGDKKHR